MQDALPVSSAEAMVAHLSSARQTATAVQSEFVNRVNAHATP